MIGRLWPRTWKAWGVYTFGLLTFFTLDVLALAFAIVFGGSALAGIPAFPTAKSGNVGALIYGFAFGFGASVPRTLGFSGALEASGRREIRSSELRTVGVALGVVAGLFAPSFAVYALIEYVAAPLIRYLAG